MSFQITTATRQGVKPLIGLYSESGCGKTYSALLLARGFVGPSGKIVMIDTESGRGSLYADIIPGGYQVINLGPPFSPSRYVEAMEAVFSSDAQILIGDSFSHSWEGTGGVLDMAGEKEASSGKPGLHCWRVPKMEHQKMMLRLLQSPIPVICNLRAKYKTRQAKVSGKTEIVKDDHTTPIQAEDFIFEMTSHAEILPDHSINLTKCSHPSLRECFPAKGPITIQTGEAIAKWCTAPGISKPVDNRAALLAKLREVTTEIHGWTRDLGKTGWDIAKPKLQRWLTDELGIDIMIDAMTPEEIQRAIQQAERKLSEVPT